MLPQMMSKLPAISHTSPEQLLKLSDILALTRLSERQLYRLMRADGPAKFPPGIALAANRRLLRWRLADVQAWLAAQAGTPVGDKH